MGGASSWESVWEDDMRSKNKVRSTQNALVIRDTQTAKNIRVAPFNMILLGLIAALAVLMATLAGCSFFPSNATTLGAKKYAVVVGINDYIDLSIRDLQYCVNDAKSVDKLLSDGWTVDLITAEAPNESINRYATKEKIKSAIVNTPIDVDTFLFYYSGHGSLDSNNNAYIVPSDFDGASYASMISTSEFSSWLGKVSAKNKTVILDSCNSGGFVNTGDSLDSDYDYTSGLYTYLQKSSAVTMFFRFGDLLAQNAASASKNPSDAPLVISAAGWNATSQEEGAPYEHGIFTYYFLQAAQTNASSGFMNGDADRDGVLSLLEAYHYAEVNLEAKTNVFGFVPHISGGLRDFALIDARN